MDGMNGGYGDSGLREEAVGRHDERAEDVSGFFIFSFRLSRPIK